MSYTAPGAAALHFEFAAPGSPGTPGALVFAFGAGTYRATSGTLQAQEPGADALAGTGQVFVHGALASVEAAPDGFAADGRVSAPNALYVREQGADVLAATGQVGIAGALAATEVGSDRCAATGRVGIAGAMQAAEVGTDTALAFGSVVARASVRAALACQWLVRTGSAAWHAVGYACTLAARSACLDAWSLIPPRPGRLLLAPYACRAGQSLAVVYAASGRVTVLASNVYAASGRVTVLAGNVYALRSGRVAHPWTGRWAASERVAVRVPCRHTYTLAVPLRAVNVAAVPATLLRL